MDDTYILAALVALLAVGGLFLTPRSGGVEAFFNGKGPDGRAPGVLTLALSQVTTWIFARSIMNAAILGFFYGIGGALAYAAYYLSFLTGAWIIRSLRFRHGYDSVQRFLTDRFGLTGAATYDFVVGLRLLSEVFANLLVIGLIFGAAGTSAYTIAILLVGAATLGYSLIGGLSASIRTDAAQMTLFLAALFALLIAAFGAGGFEAAPILASTPEIENPGWVLLAVALLQVWSYPLHDPVMMDRGFIANRRTTMASFYHAAWISTLCILAFGVLGVWAGLNKLDGEGFTDTLSRLIGGGPTLLFNAALIISCMSTLDSAFSSAAKLTVVDMRLAKPTLRNGRIAMAAFMIGGLLLVFFGAKDLFDAVAVSGTASMFLAPVVFFSLWMGRTDVPLWSYVTAFAAAMAAAVIYFLEAGGYSSLMTALTGLEHKYSKLLVLCVGVLGVGCGAFALGLAMNARRGQAATPH
ncbi:MAG: sodium:proline symporter [Pseudomonadota bacterium]